MFTACRSPWVCTVDMSLIRSVSKGFKEMCMARIPESLSDEGGDKAGSVAV